MKKLARSLFTAAVFALLIIAAMLTGNSSQAANSEAYVAKLTASDSGVSDQFGVSVSTSGNTAVVGAFGDNIGANNFQGSAYVFIKSGGSWTQQQKLTANDGAAMDQFGISVAISGDTIIVGANRASVGATANHQGSAYVFTRTGTTWTQQQKLTAADGTSSAQFGSGIALSVDTAIISAVSDAVGGNSNQGAAYIFVKSGGSWTQQQKLTANDGAVGDFFGKSVAISGDTIIVGAFFDNIGVTDQKGSAYVFTKNGATWTQQQKLTAADGAAGDQFGTSVAINGDAAIIGAAFADINAVMNQGAAYVFVRSGGSWTQQQKLTANASAANGTQFGKSVAIGSDTVFVGADFDDSIQFGDEGSIYKFAKNGAMWIPQQKMTAADGTANAYFGFSLALSDTTLITGSYNDNGGAGSAYVFDLSNSRPPYDFDGDGKADLTVFRPSNGVWYLQQSTNGFAAFAFGLTGDVITPADYDGDGKTDIAVFRPSDNTWYIQRSTLGFISFALGAAGDVPMPADFSGDGRAELAVFRPSNGTWYQFNLATRQSSSLVFGLNGDVPVAADYDADGKADIAVFRPSTGVWYINQSTAGIAVVQFGITGDKAVPGDYDGDGKADIAVWRPSSGVWYLQQSTNGFAATAFGITNDLPAPADFDGDGKTDLGIFRPSNGAWYLQRSSQGFTQIQFGASGDKPAPNAFVP